MLSFTFVTFLVGAAAAQLMPGSASVPVAATATQPGYPNAPSPTNFYNVMPYSAYQSGGYKSLQCGYGYAKQSDGSCSAESWVR
jgi:hypothetical protein